MTSGDKSLPQTAHNEAAGSETNREGKAEYSDGKSFRIFVI